MKMRFKYSPKPLIGKTLTANPQSIQFQGVVDKPVEIPDSAVRSGRYLVRFGKGDAREYEYISELNVWIDRGKVYYRYGKPFEWETFLFITPSEFEAMSKIPHMLKDEWALAYINEEERRMKRKRRINMFKLMHQKRKPWWKTIRGL